MTEMTMEQALELAIECLNQHQQFLIITGIGDGIEHKRAADILNRTQTAQLILNTTIMQARIENDNGDVLQIIPIDSGCEIEQVVEKSDPTYDEVGE